MKNLKLLKEIFLFALPIITGQIGQMLFGVGDIIVAGHYSALAVSAIGVAAAIFAPFLMVGIGILLCTGPITSEKKGRGESDPTLLFNSFIVATMSSLVIIIAILVLAYNIQWLGLNPQIAPTVALYLKWTAGSIWPALIFQATKEFLQAESKTYVSNGLILFFNLVNVALCAVFMFGWGPIPEFGVLGAAIVTSICRILMAVSLYFYMKKVCAFETKKNNETLKKIFKLGLPISFTILCEVLVFSTVTVLVGKMSLVASASQSLVINLTSLTFMVPLAIGSAVAVLVGEQMGKKSIEGILRYSLGSLFLALMIQILFATLYLTIPGKLLGVASSDPVIIAYASALLFWVGLFQIPDGLQVVLSGVMRGLHETKIPMILGFISYWIIGLPIGCYFTYRRGLEARGLWMGLAIGLLCMCILLFILYKNKIKRLCLDLSPATQN
ncbi:MAG: MATE family efflux transporter [Bacteriovorax sp.]|nr:MATE family efflux transporter [Bacteriovorax sp.]